MLVDLEYGSLPGSATLQTIGGLFLVTCNVCVLLMTTFYFVICLGMHIVAVVLDTVCFWTRVVLKGAGFVATVIYFVGGLLRRFAAVCFVLITANSRCMSEAASASSILSFGLLKTDGCKWHGRNRKFYQRVSAEMNSALLSATFPPSPSSALDCFAYFCSRLMKIAASPGLLWQRQRRVRFASEDSVCLVPRCQMTDDEKEAMHHSKEELRAHKAEQSWIRKFEDSQSHEHFHKHYRRKMRGTQTAFTEEYFFYNKNGELEHPAFWEYFYEEVFPLMSSESPVIPGFATWEAYKAHVHFYRDFYKTCIMWYGNDFCQSSACKKDQDGDQKMCLATRLHHFCYEWVQRINAGIDWAAKALWSVAQSMVMSQKLEWVLFCVFLLLLLPPLAIVICQESFDRLVLYFFMPAFCDLAVIAGLRLHWMFWERRIRFARGRHLFSLCLIEQCKDMSSAQKKACFNAGPEMKSMSLHGQFEQAFELFRCHDFYDDDLFMAFRADTVFTLTEETFYTDSNGTKCHPAYWHEFYNDIVPSLPGHKTVPGYASWDEYLQYLHSYEVFYQTSIVISTFELDKNIDVDADDADADAHSDADVQVDADADTEDGNVEEEDGAELLNEEEDFEHINEAAELVVAALILPPQMKKMKVFGPSNRSRPFLSRKCKERHSK